MLNQRLPNPIDDASVHNANVAHEDANYNNAGQGGGRGNQGGRGGGPIPQARRVPNAPENYREDDGLGRIKFSIPPFSFDNNDIEEYLKWELKIEKLWRLHNFTEDKKLNLPLLSLMDMLFNGGTMLWNKDEELAN